MFTLSQQIKAAVLIAMSNMGVSHKLHAPARRIGPKREGGGGTRRAAKRLAAKREANKLIPSSDVMTRQRRRSAWRLSA